MRPTLACLATLAFACDAACGGGSGAGASGSSDLPEALREMDEYAEVVPFDGWSVEGIRLYRASWAVPDQSSARIVGVDDDGALVEGPELMRRFGDLSPAQMATRAFGVLMAEHGSEPLSPGDRTEHRFGSDAEWAAVAEPRVVDGVLVFYGFRGEMSPTLVEHRVDTATFELDTTPVTQVLVDRGEVVALGGPVCVAIARCGCWDGCARAEVVQVPEGRRGTHRLLDGDEAGTLIAPREGCRGEQCFRVCRADSPTADCDEGAPSRLDEECEESCPPSEAPYHCETLEDGCRRVDHPTRRAAAADG